MEMLHGLCSDPRAVKRCVAVNPDADTHDDARPRQVSLLIQAALVIAMPIQKSRLPLMPKYAAIHTHRDCKRIMMGIYDKQKCPRLIIHRRSRICAYDRVSWQCADHLGASSLYQPPIYAQRHDHVEVLKRLRPFPDNGYPDFGRV